MGGEADVVTDKSVEKAVVTSGDTSTQEELTCF